ncbi:peptidase M4 family protein [Rhodocytophaga rosea]|uniref:Neutral metalloproteinase n=1 Tax=Rhodocytophaga rosea TaxID=2704465 RepID=A0A6C0GE38_9BACT|nr:M4 family metallopeptidase [Rhodocytophaga rosea]QHT66269.1 peptidase M4 family protein [Rhodocytophaga rosea]
MSPTLSQEQALQKALAFVGAKTYKWQIASEEAWVKELKNDTKATHYPKGELVICKIYRKNHQIIENGDLTLAYKFDVFSHEPISRAHIYVDAHTGTVIHQDAIIKHVDGTAHTRYSGQRTVATTLSNGSYRLRDASRGSGVETYNMQRGTSYGSAVDFMDNDNQWTGTEHDNSNKDNASLDCHLGAIKTYDYFKNVLGRNSFDGNGAAIKCYVHYGQGYENAFWNGSVMTFGDGEMNGSTGSQPLTTLDITAHEIAHAVCQYTAGLVYSYESGAMNEGFSDIWGAVVEHSVDPTKSIWTMGDDANFAIRSMSNPNAFQHPDTYLGQYWYSSGGDNGGVHYNSDVLNHWFYLLSVGKTGANDNGDNYAVTGIGIDKAARIAYRTESVYLTSNSEYKDARTFSIQAAKDLYGATSQEAIQTANAWYAVGVYDTQSTPTNLTATTASGTQINLAWTDNSTVETGFIIERSTAAASGFIQIATVAANATTYANKGLATDAVYYYRVKAALGTTSSTYAMLPQPL